MLGGGPAAGIGGCPRPGRPRPAGAGVPRRFGFAISFRGDPVDASTTDRYLAMALDTTIVQGHGGPRTCGDRTRDAGALRRQLDPVGLHLARIGCGVVLMPPLSHAPNPEPHPPRVAPSPVAGHCCPAVAGDHLPVSVPIVVPEGP